MRSTIETDSGSYVDGSYTTKNGTTGTGLACPKGKRLYDQNMTPAIFYQPDDVGATEQFVLLDRDVAPDVLPYYAISNYGRVMNVNTGKVMKPNYRPNGYEYYCLAADNSKTGQKKYITHRMVMMTFDPIDNMENMQVNHCNYVKSDNYVDKTMPDGSVQSNLEWCTPSYNCMHRSDKETYCHKITDEDVRRIRDLHMQGYSYVQIQSLCGYEHVSGTTIQNICRNKSHVDKSYIPPDKYNFYRMNTGGRHYLTDDDARKIRDLKLSGLNSTQIRNEYYPDFSLSTILDIVNGVSHNR